MNRIDKKLYKLGFKKTVESKTMVSYERYNEEIKYKQIVDILKNRIYSYQAGINSDGFNNCICLTYEENKLFMKKYRQMKRIHKWGKENE